MTIVSRAQLLRAANPHGPVVFKDPNPDSEAARQGIIDRTAASLMTLGLEVEGYGDTPEAAPGEAVSDDPGPPIVADIEASQPDVG